MNRASQLANLKRLLENDEKKPPSPFYTFKATEKRARLAAKLFRRAYENDAVVAWHNVLVPSELFWALDIIPFCPENSCAMLGSSNIANSAFEVANKNSYSSDVCSFLRFSAGAALDNFFPGPDVLVCTNYHCDNASKTFDNLSRIYNKKLFFLDIPHNYSSVKAVEFVAEQIRNIFYDMAHETGRKPDEARLSEAIQYSNQARHYFLCINELRRNVPAPIHGAEAIDYSAMVSNTWGTPEIIPIYKTLQEELEERVKSNTGVIVGGERYRIFWRHLRPYHSTDILSYMADRWKAVIAFEEFNYLHWDKLEPEKPFISLAKKILSDPAVGRVEHWLNKIYQVLMEYRINGVITFCHWGCRHLSGPMSMIEQATKKKNMPVLNLDGDSLDTNRYCEGQTKTHIDAFFELLAEKTGRENDR